MFRVCMIASTSADEHSTKCQTQNEQLSKGDTSVSQVESESPEEQREGDVSANLTNAPLARPLQVAANNRRSSDRFFLHSLLLASCR